MYKYLISKLSLKIEIDIYLNAEDFWMAVSSFSLNYMVAVFLYLGVPIFLIPLIYYKIENTFLDRELKKIYNLNFSFNYRETKNFLVDMGLLIFGYMVSGYFVAYILKELCEYILNIEVTDQNFIPIACASLAFCFAARYTCRKKGYEKGKQILLLMASVASIAFMIKWFIGTGDQFFENLSESTFFVYVIFLYFKYLYLSLLSHCIDTAFYLYQITSTLLIGSFMTALIGEMVLVSNNSCNKFVCNHQSLYGFVPHFSNFEFIPYYELSSKMKEMTKGKNIKSIKIISHTLDIFEIVYLNLLQLVTKSDIPNIKILAPDLQHIRYYGTFITFRFNKKGLGQFEHLKGKRYGENYKKLMSLHNDKKIKWVNKDFREFRIIIVNTDKCLLILDSRTPSGRKIGLYTENQDLIQHYIKIFNSKCH